MTTIRDYIKERLGNKSVDEVSRLYFPRYWSLQDSAEAKAEAELADALTEYDQPCMSNFQ